MNTRSAFQPNGVKNFELGSTGLLNDANLVSYWKFESNGNDEKSAYNLSANGSPTYPTGKFSNGLRITTYNTDFLSSTTNLGIDGGSTSIGGWFKLDADISSGSGTFWGQYSTGTDTGYGVDYEYNAGTRRLRFWRLRQGVTQASAYYNVSLGTGWNHIVLTYDGANVYGYLNGIQVTSVATSGNGTVNLGSGFTISGAQSNSNVDDMFVFSRALSATEVGYLYSLGTTKAYYPLNGNSTDFSGNGNTGTDTAITYPQGRFGQGAKFNGSSSVIRIADSASLSGTGSHTISGWIYLNALPTSGSDYWCILKGVDYPVTSKWGLGIYCGNPSGTTNFVSGCVTTVPSTTYYEARGFNPKPNQWYHVTSVFKNDTQKIQLYVNGNFITETSTGTILRYGGGGAMGSFIDSSNVLLSQLNGALDEVIIENRAWTAKEVETYYRKSVQNYRKGFWAKLLQSFTITDTLSLTENSTNLRARNFTTTDTLSLSEVISALKGISFTVIDTLHLSEVFTGARTFVFNIIDSLGLSEVFNVRKKWEQVDKNSSTWTSSNKSSASTFTETNKSSSSWTETDKS